MVATGDHVLEYFLQTTRAVLLDLCENLELFNACRKVRASPPSNKVTVLLFKDLHVL